jgi:hypothetical protein
MGSFPTKSFNVFTLKPQGKQVEDSHASDSSTLQENIGRGEKSVHPLILWVLKYSYVSNNMTKKDASIVTVKYSYLFHGLFH